MSAARLARLPAPTAPADTDVGGQAATRTAISRFTSIDQLPSLLRVEEVAAWADVSKGVVYESIRCNALASVRIGRLVRVPRSAIETWLRAAEDRAS